MDGKIIISKQIYYGALLGCIIGAFWHPDQINNYESMGVLLLFLGLIHLLKW